MEQQTNLTEYDLSLTDLIDVDTLQKIQDAFSTMSGAAALTTDINGVAVTEGSNFTDFCMRYTRTSEVGCSRCEECDHLGAELALKEGRSVVYPCHAGLLDFAAPIMANGKMVGCFIGGQVLTKHVDPEYIHQVANEIGVDPDEYLAAAEKINIMDQKHLDHATESLFTIANVLSNLAYSSYLMHHANEELKRAAGMKSDFLANMSHEIRTPMNAVIGMAEMALREDLPPVARNYINQIKSAGKSLLTIINDILDFSKIESGKMDINEVDYEPLSLINDVASIVVTRLEDKDVELILDVSPTLPNKLQGDNIRIKQVLLNLANNATKFTSHGRIILSVGYEPIDDCSINLQVSIQDTGIGIKEEDLDKLFQSFQQLDSKRNRNIEGTGLGLAISKQLVNLMNGDIKVESEYNKGSTFSFTIPQEIMDDTPIVKVEDPEDILVAALISNDYVRDHLEADVEKLGVAYTRIRTVSDIKDLPVDKKAVFLFVENPMFSDPVEEFVRNHPQMTAVLLIKFNDAVRHDLTNLVVLKKPVFILNVAAILNGQELYYEGSEMERLDKDFIAPDANILIVDDSAINLTVAEGLLEPLKMQIDTAISGKLALEMIEEKHYDIIFMDHMMPELDGVETTHLIRRFHPEYHDVPIIALTANAVDGTKEMFCQEGMNDFVAKPIELRRLINAVRQWLPIEKIQKSATATTVIRSDTPIELEVADLDVNGAVKLLGSEQLFFTILKDYYNLIEKKASQIKVLEETGNWPAYTIEVHALKSASRQIGANTLADKAAELEKAGNARDTFYIRSNTDDMLEQYCGYLTSLKPFCAEEEEEEAPKESATIDELNSCFADMRAAMEELDMDQMEEVVSRLKGYSYDDVQADLFSRLKEASDSVDVDACEEIIKEWEALLN